MPHDLGRLDGDPLVLVVEFDDLGGSAAVHVGAELVALRGAAHSRHDLVSDDQGPDVAALALGDESLDQHVLLGRLQGLDHGLRDLGVGCEDDPDALGSLQQLDDDRCPTHPLDGGQDIGAITGEHRRGDANAVSGQDLDGTQLVARVGDPVRGVGCVHVHLLELANHCQAEIGDGRTDPGQHRVVVGEGLSPVLQVRFLLREVDGESQGVEHSGLVAALGCCRLEALGAVGTRSSGEDCQLHDSVETSVGSRGVGERGSGKGEAPAYYY